MDRAAAVALVPPRRRYLTPQARERRREDRRGETERALTGLLGYLARHRGRMDYRGRLERGRAIGSGQIESMCKHTLNRRLRKNNPRRLHAAVDRLVGPCRLHASDRWDRF